MHEMSLAESVLQIIEQSAHEQGFRQVNTVWLEIGQLSGVEVDAMRFSFEVVVRDSLAEGARLEIVRTAGQGQCTDCGRTVPIRQLFDACPECGECHVQPTRGLEMRVKELEVE